MKRSAPLTRTRLARGKDRGIPTKVREQVRQRSQGWCEVGWSNAEAGRSCWSPDDRPVHGLAGDLHHLVKRPRLHEPWALVHLCRRHHELCEGPYAKGRLRFWMYWGPPRIYYEPQRELTSAGPPTGLAWRIEVRARKDSPLLRVLAEGTIQL